MLVCHTHSVTWGGCLPSENKALSLIPGITKHSAQVLIFIPSQKLIRQWENEVTHCHTGNTN